MTEEYKPAPLVCLCCKREVKSINGWEICETCTEYQDKVIDAITKHCNARGMNQTADSIRDGHWANQAEWLQEPDAAQEKEAERKDLDELLGLITIDFPDDRDYYMEHNKLTEETCDWPKGWHAVCDDNGYIAFFFHEADAFAFRLWIINLRLNGGTVLRRYGG